MFAPKLSSLSGRFDVSSQPQPAASILLDQRRSVPAGGRDRRVDRMHQRNGAAGSVSLTGAPSMLWTAITPLPLPRPRLLQTKLKIGALTDPLERAADQVADQVMRMSFSNVPSSGTRQIQRKCAQCEEEDKTVRRKPAASPHLRSLNNEAPALVDHVLGGPASPLIPNDLAFFEPRFGFDFSRVRVHTDSAAAESARSLNAIAYAAGSDIAFGSGQYQPGTDVGRRLIAHELAHIVQQSAGDRGYLRRLRDIRKVPLVLSCPIPPSNAEPTEEYVLFPNRETTLNGSQKLQIGNYVERYHAAGGNGPVRVDGFASEPGDDALNWQLSCSRASSVKDELVHPSAAKTPGLAPFVITTFMQGETAEFGAEAQNRRATIFPPIATNSKNKPVDPASDEVKPQDKPYPPTFFSCAVDSNCPDDHYCRPFPTLQEALNDRAADGESVLSTIATANSHAEPLFRKYIFNPGPAGDISAEYGADFAQSRTTRYVTEQIFSLVRADIQSNPPDFPSGAGWVTVDFDTDPSKAALKQRFNEVATTGLVFTDKFEVPGLIAGGVGANQGFCTVGANTSGAQADSRSARVSAEVFKNPDGTLLIDPNVYYTVVDTIDFCPGDCGGFFARYLGNTVQMSRWEASGISGDVPFTVTFQGPSLIGVYNSED